MTHASRRRAQSKAWRREQVEKVGVCEICGRSPDRPHRGKPREMSQLCVHEIANGIHRTAAQDKPYATLVLCWLCNGYKVTNKRQWPEARQLAVLKHSRPDEYDLTAYNTLVNPRAPERITQGEVDTHRGRGVGLVPGLRKNRASLD